MKKKFDHRIEAVVLYCSNDSRFFKTCIDNLLSLGIKCNVVTFSHLWMGEEESKQLFQQSHNLYDGNPNYKYKHIQWQEGYTTLYWEAYGRKKAIDLVEKDCEYI